MLPTIAISYNALSGQRGLDRLIERGPYATARALNRSIATVRTFMARAIASDLALPVGTVRERLVIREASATNQKATVSVSGKRIPLIEFVRSYTFPSRGRGRGVSYTLPSGKGRLEHAFVARMATGHMGVFLRKGARRLPIREAFGPSLPHVFDKFVPEAIKQGDAALLKNLEHEFAFAMRGIAA